MEFSRGDHPGKLHVRGRPSIFALLRGKNRYDYPVRDSDDKCQIEVSVS